MVVGTRVKYFEEAEVLTHVVGYLLVSDVSERRFNSKCGGRCTQGQDPRHIRCDRPLAAHENRDRCGPVPVPFRSRAHVRRPCFRRPRVISSPMQSVGAAGCRSR
ncbi:hypothetical protein [Paracoccus rhizosphaerae]|uniref:Uncharacterized protein n=1 Tax=Paracoccus rhizosphaerae TaxID=1133347 RepID=A0ABV6CDL2_9RHOB